MIVRTPSSYYIVMSHKTGYRPNSASMLSFSLVLPNQLSDVVAYRAKSLSGPWSAPYPIAPLGTRTFSSQSLLNIRIKGTQSTTYIYVGDSWSGTGAELGESRYIWLPAHIDEKKGTFKIEWYDLFSVDITTGKWAPVPPHRGRTYEAEAGEVTGAAWKQECGHCSGNTIVAGIKGTDSTLTIRNIVGTGKPQWVSFYYVNADDMVRAHVFLSSCS